MEWLSDWGAWLIVGFILLILETLAAGVFIMWWGISALIVAGIVALMPYLPLSWQAAIFAVIAIVFSLIWWKFQRNKDAEEDKISSLNSREHAMLGAKGVIVDILENGTVRGKFGDTTWRVNGTRLKVGDSVEVIKVDGITLTVKQIEL